MVRLKGDDLIMTLSLQVASAAPAHRLLLKRPTPAPAVRTVLFSHQHPFIIQPRRLLLWPAVMEALQSNAQGSQLRSVEVLVIRACRYLGVANITPLRQIDNQRRFEATIAGCSARVICEYDWHSLIWRLNPTAAV